MRHRCAPVFFFSPTETHVYIYWFIHTYVCKYLFMYNNTQKHGCAPVLLQCCMTHYSILHTAMHTATHCNSLQYKLQYNTLYAWVRKYVVAVLHDSLLGACYLMLEDREDRDQALRIFFKFWCMYRRFKTSTCLAICGVREHWIFKQMKLTMDFFFSNMRKKIQKRNTNNTFKSHLYKITRPPLVMCLMTCGCHSVL